MRLFSEAFMLHVVLYRPEIPQNTGNIMRTCVATGTTLHLIGPLPFDLNEKSLKRAGLDYIADLKYFYYGNYDEFVAKNPSANLYYVTRYADKTYSSFDLSDKIHDSYLMFGRESTGIPHDILRENPDRCMRLPMIPMARSLNLSNCVAIVVYEALRQQNFPNLSTTEVIKGPDFLQKEKNR
jgi:tRNA (cytidine/uridine-2'-O-)-methyltransferase